MKLSQIDEELEKSGLEGKQKQAILTLIDAKIDNDMEKLISVMEGWKGQVEGWKGQVEGWKNEMKTENASLKSEMKTENASLRNEIKIVYWVIGIATGVISLVLWFSSKS